MMTGLKKAQRKAQPWTKVTYRKRIQRPTTFIAYHQRWNSETKEKNATQRRRSTNCQRTTFVVAVPGQKHVDSKPKGCVDSVIQKLRRNSRRRSRHLAARPVPCKQRRGRLKNRRKVAGTRSRQLRFVRNSASSHHRHRVRRRPAQCNSDKSTPRYIASEERQSSEISVSLMICCQQRHIGVHCRDGEHHWIHHFDQNGVHQHRVDGGDSELLLGEELFLCSRMAYENTVKALAEFNQRYAAGVVAMGNNYSTFTHSTLLQATTIADIMSLLLSPDV